MGILNNHIPIITFLRPGIITIKTDDEKKFYVEEGTVEFSNNNLLILTSTARDVANFDKSLVKELLQKAELNLNDTDTTDKERYVISYKLETLKEISQ
jgi:F0F1-type ATP synthase epsilon subunit